MSMSSADIPELFSENISEKPKRGRPPVLWQGETMSEETILRDMQGFAKGASHRSVLNAHYLSRALSLLIKNCKARRVTFPNCFSWLCNNKSGTQQRIRRVVLYELGRIDDDQLLLAMARELCKQEPSARGAITMIRRCRGCQRKHGDPLDFANEIIRTLNDYLCRHPEMTNEDALSALRTAASQVERGTRTDTEATP
jgi:hypothetical protein